MFSLLICSLLSSLAKSNPIVSKDLPQCSSGVVDTNCETTTSEITQSDPLSSYYQSFISNANISFRGCTFKQFHSQVNDIAGIIHISSEQANLYSSFFSNCRFENNQLSSPIITILMVQTYFDNVIFTENTISQGSMIRLAGQINLMLGCQFNGNKLNGNTFSFQSAFTSSLISLYDRATIHIQNCCFMVQSDNTNNFVLHTDENSQVMISQNTVFDCSINQAFLTHKKSTKSFIFDETTIYSGSKCYLNSFGSNLTDPTNPPDNGDDKEKKISKYLYIGIGAAAGLIVLGIIIFLIFRIAGKCKRLEHKSANEGIELEEKRSSYLLQEGEEQEEIIPKEEEKNE